MLPFLRSTALVLVAVAATACASGMNVSSHVARGLDVSAYRTYDWGPPDALPTGDPRLDKDPVFQDRVQGAVEKQLAAQGFRRVTSGEPDLLIHYHASIDRRIDVNRTDRAFGYCYDEDCLARVVEYEAGTLVLDIVDTRTKRVIWRGWAQDSVEDALANPDTMARKVNEAVTRMLARFPHPPQQAPAGR